MTIVCGVDASEAAEPVADAARWLADGLADRLVVVHVVEEPVQEAEELALAVRTGLDAGREVRLAEGAPVEALMRAAEEEGAGFLVVGSRGRRSLRSGLFGSVSRELATRARTPVMVVPPDISRNLRTEDGAEPSVVCGVDGSEHALLAARVADRLAQRLQWRLIVVHALPGVSATAAYLGASPTTPPLSGQQDARQRQAAQIVRDAVASLEVEAATVVEDGAPWDVLESVANREAGQILVVAARGLGAVRTAVFGSVAARLAASARRPVMMVPEPAEATIVGSEAP